MCVCTSRYLCTIATGRVDMCTRDGEEEFQGRVNAFEQGFLMRSLPDIAEGRLSAFNIG